MDPIYKLKIKHCWPEVAHIDSYDFSLDGGGRTLVTDYIKENSPKILIEVGCFLNGSSKLWLESSPDLLVIGIDPWEGPWHETLVKYKTSLPRCFDKIKDVDKFINSVEENGNFNSALANIKQYQERYIPVRGYSPGELHELKRIGIKPDIIYIDSVKHREDLDVAFNLFENVKIFGDDWTWGKDEGYPIRKAVTSFCEDHNLKYSALKATWEII